MGLKQVDPLNLGKLVLLVAVVAALTALAADQFFPVFELLGWATPLALGAAVLLVTFSIGFGGRAGATLVATSLCVFFWLHFGIQRGLDLRGGAALVYQLEMDDVPRAQWEETLQNTVRVIEERVNTIGLKDLKVDALPPTQFEVQFPGKETSEVQRIKDILTRLGQLEFRIVALPPQKGDGHTSGLEDSEREKKRQMGAAYPGPPAGTAWVPPRIVRNEQGEVVSGGVERLVEYPESGLLEEIKRLEGRKQEDAIRDRPEAIAEIDMQIAGKQTELESIRKKNYFTGEDLDPAGLGIRQGDFGASWVVAFAMQDKRKVDFGDFTTANKRRLMAILIDGHVESAPVIQETLPGRGQISGGGMRGFSRDEANDLVTVLRSGSLRAEITLQSEFAIGPSLGEAAIRRGVLATAIGMLAVLLFMVGTYFFPGLVAVLALFMNLVIIMGSLAFAGAQLSLPGIAGVILTVGMAVDANILVFERIREERKLGKSLVAAVKAGYERAFITIMDANVTTLFTAGVLVWFTTGQVRGFGITLICGILASMFTALFVTRGIFEWMLKRGWIGELKMPEIIGVPKISYIKVRAPLILMSIVLIVAGVSGFEATVDDLYDIEFSGGQRVAMNLNGPLGIKEVKDRITAEFKDATVVSIKSDKPDAAELDLATESDAFQITIRGANTDEAQAKVLDFLAEEFQGILAPPGITSFDGNPTEFQLSFNRTVDPEEVAALLAGTGGMTDPEVLDVDGAVAKVRVVLGEGGDPVFRENLARALSTKSLALSEPFPAKSFVDPKTAQGHRDDAIKAVLIALVFQILYIYFRFHGASFGFAAVIALVHDVLITLGAIAFFSWSGLVNVKINLPIIAAILTLIGYSMNDTIVVFDRIRENLGRGKKSLAEVIDHSVNQTMNRTLRTSITTFVVVLALFLVNYGAASSVLEGFAFVLMVGVLTGTYSSIFVASPMLLFLPWHYLRGKGGRFWALVAITLTGAVAGLFTEMMPAWYTWTCIAMLLAYPVYVLVDLVLWIVLPDPDRSLNRVLRSQGHAD